MVPLFTAEKAAQKTRPTPTAVLHHLPHSVGGAGAKIHCRFVHFV